MQKVAQEIFLILQKNGNKQVAKEQAQYMRNRYPFLGLKQPERKAITKDFFQKFGKISTTESIELAKCCFDYAEREMWYVGCEILDKNKKKLTANDLPFIKNSIVKSDWWDIVDTLAVNAVGSIVANDIRLEKEMEQYSHNENFWIRRTALLFQLKYKEKTNEKFLFEKCQQMAHEKEFFIQKAIGWALREYAKTAPQNVVNFVTNKPLAPLSKREALKHFK